MYENNKIEIVLPTPHKYQKKVLNSKARFRVLCCGRQFGKSTVCQLLALDTMFQEKSVAYLTPSFSLATEFYNQLIDLLPASAIEYTSKADLSIKLLNKGKLKFFSGESTRSIRGNKFHRVIIDEAAHIPDLEEIWTQVIMATLTVTNGDAIFVSSPYGRNYFYTLFEKGQDLVDGFESFHYTSYDSPYANAELLELTRKSVPEATFRQEYLAEPLSSNENPFGDHIKCNTIEELSTKETVVYGIDIASAGSGDWTVICGLDEDFCMSYFDRFRAEAPLVEEKIKSLPAETLKVVDRTGSGITTFQHLQSKVNNLQGFVFSGKSKPDLMIELITDIEHNKIKFNKKTADEMESFKFFQTSTGHPKYEAQSGAKDDCIMALAMANKFAKQAMASKNWRLYFI